ncbi:MAG: hypothetical protein COV10_02940 [Candidatus Vogelbacteria bacterium CG10_big_fil_rev_8_21_14_0_10_51_16]|uniref:Phospho-N-acetylmuramoyl-pentapeptide-transferase n=1 Tax=Candidatus Vogelbacteria bacterium CG10_big_fil_rev_8_21_14_0_10_51_16 TaxID=1975045 RepID=A0A2H0RG94_9BACT|nr:MAG: hypothetical protein COV10_02940 [Candidatus Vogelbacteria bacterium CG10_big_fil_rev_8_21_14_0_10_51_16]
MFLDIIKIFVPLTIAFLVGMAITPALADYLYRNKMWKKKNVPRAMDGHSATITAKLHNDEERKTPRMGGIVVWGSVLLTTLLFWMLAALFPTTATEKLSFLSRNQTWLPLFSLVVAALVGLVDDLLQVREQGAGVGGGLSATKRIVAVLFIGLVGALWFYLKLGVSTVSVPFLDPISLGFFFVPFFMIVMLALFSGGVIDGLDGLSGGIFASMFAAYSGIAFAQQQIDIAAFCAVVVGAVLAFLWYNIPPARFFLSETGALALTVTLAVVAFLTDAVLALVIIAFPLWITSASSIIQMLSKRFRGGRKVFLVAPLHHHFQALGWPATKVVMRYWIVGVVTSVAGMVVAIVGKL